MQISNETSEEASAAKSRCNTSHVHQTKGKQLSTKELNHNNHHTNHLKLVLR